MTLNLQPTLSGKSLTLRPLRAEDYDELFSLASDPLIWEQLPQSNRYQRAVFTKLFEDSLSSRGTLAAVDNRTDEIIGWSRYYELDESRASVAIGYTFLSRRYWGTGYNREMKDLMLGHAFTGVDTAIFHIAEINKRSQKAIEKLGATLASKGDREFDGAKHAYLTYKIGRDAWSPEL